MKKYVFVIYLILTTAISLVPIIKILDLKGLYFFWQINNPHPDIIIAAIDNKSIQEIGRWPWNRNVYADFLNFLQNKQIRAVGFDITFSETENFLNDSLFSEAIKNSSFPIILSAEKDLLPIEILIKNPNVKSGDVNVELAYDGKVRNFPNEISFASILAKSLDYPLPKNTN